MCYESRAGDDRLHLVVLLLEHPGLAFVQLTHHLQHVGLLHLQAGPLPPAVLEQLHLVVVTVQLLPLEVVLLVHQHVVDELLDVAVEESEELQVGSLPAIYCRSRPPARLLLLLVDAKQPQTLEQLLLAHFAVGHEDLAEDDEGESQVSVLSVPPSDVLAVWIPLVLLQGVDQVIAALLGLRLVDLDPEYLNMKVSEKCEVKVCLPPSLP